MKIRNLPQSLDRFTIVLLTDVHVGPTVDRKRVEEIVAKTNALHPDMVAIAGDLVDGFLRNLALRTKPLANLKSKYGTYFATGTYLQIFHPCIFSGTVVKFISFSFYLIFLVFLFKSSLQAVYELTAPTLCIVWEVVLSRDIFAVIL